MTATYLYWQCAWVEATLSATDTAEYHAGLDMLSGWDDTAWYRDNVVSPEGSWVDDVVTPAYGGQQEPLERSWSNGCDGYRAFKTGGAS